jgi:hypothetical protein
VHANTSMVTARDNLFDIIGSPYLEGAIDSMRNFARLRRLKHRGVMLPQAESQFVIRKFPTQIRLTTITRPSSNSLLEVNYDRRHVGPRPAMLNFSVIPQTFSFQRTVLMRSAH